MFILTLTLTPGPSHTFSYALGMVVPQPGAARSRHRHPGGSSKLPSLPRADLDRALDARQVNKHLVSYSPVVGFLPLIWAVGRNLVRQKLANDRYRKLKDIH